MIASEPRGHYRSSTINRYEDFHIKPEDEQQIKESIFDPSTKETPINDTPIAAEFQTDILKIIEGIKNRIKLEQISMQEKKKGLRNMLLEDFFKNATPSVMRGKKKGKRPNMSIGKGMKKVMKITPSKSKGKLGEGKMKKTKSFVPSIRDSHHKSSNVPKLPAKTLRNGSTNLDYKPSFLV
jgi:hypothetical protein